MSKKAAAKAASGDNARVHFVTGNEEVDVKRAAQELANNLAPADAGEFGIEIIDGAADNVEQAVERLEQAIGALLTMPFFGGGKLVWLKNTNVFSDTVTGRSETVTQAVEKLLDTLDSGLPEGITFLISAPEADKRRAAYKKLCKAARVYIHDKKDFGWKATEQDIIQFIAHRVRERELRLSEEALETLAARVGAEVRQLENELEKLDLAIGKARRIEAEDIRALVPQTREGGIFDLSNAISRRDLPLAVATLRQLLAQGESAIGLLLAAIVPTVRNLLLVKDLMETHRLSPPAEPQFFASALKRIPEEALSHLPRKKDGTLNTYPLGLAAMNAVRFSLEHLRQGFAWCLEANLQLVSTQFPHDVLLERLLVRLLSVR